MKHFIELPEIQLNSVQLEQFQDYFSQIILWEKKTDLIGSEDFNNFFQRHILNCLSIKELIQDTDQLIYDVGSGAGLPGLVLALIDNNPNRQYVLFEKKYQKRSFLMNMVLRFKLKNVFIAENFPDIYYTKCNILTSRALLSLMDLKNYYHFCDKFILFKGKNYIQEINGLKLNNIPINLKLYKIANDDSYLISGESNECFT